MLKPGSPFTLNVTPSSRKNDLTPVLGAYRSCGILRQLIGIGNETEGTVATLTS